MRILVVHNRYAQPGGEDAVVASECAALRARGHELHLCVRDSAELHAAPLRGVAETLATIRNPHAGHELERNVRALQPDVVHLHNLFPRWGLAALHVLDDLRVPTVQTLHNFRYLCAPATRLLRGEDCSRCSRGNFAHAVRFACMRNSRLVSAGYALALATNRASGIAERAVQRFVCVSELVRRRHLEAGFAPDRLVVKGNFVESTFAGASERDGSVFYAGRLSTEKGVAVLIAALSRLPRVLLRVAGDGPELSGLREQAARQGAHVQFLGRLPKAELWQQLQRTSVCVVPSIGSETFGLAALEAFACACPVVATDAGGLPELVHDGVNGFVVPRANPELLAERIRWLLADKQRASAMGLAGQALVQAEYLPDRNLSALEAIYQAAIDARRSG